MIRRCTSGQKIPGLREKHEPCSQALTSVRDRKTSREVLLCPRCDGDAGRLAARNEMTP